MNVCIHQKTAAVRYLKNERPFQPLNEITNVFCKTTVIEKPVWVQNNQNGKDFITILLKNPIEMNE